MISKHFAKQYQKSKVCPRKRYRLHTASTDNRFFGRCFRNTFVVRTSERIVRATFTFDYGLRAILNSRPLGPAGLQGPMSCALYKGCIVFLSFRKPESYYGLMHFLERSGRVFVCVCAGVKIFCYSLPSKLLQK